MKLRISLMTALVVPLLFIFSTAEAASWPPAKEVRIIVAYKPGGQTDLFARKIASIIQSEKLLPVNVLVVNIPGGNTLEALNTVQKADPDGTTFLFHNTAILTMKALGQSQLTVDDFCMVSQLLEMMGVISVRGDAKWKNYDEFIADAKAKPGTIRMAIPGIALVNHFFAINFENQTGMRGVYKEIPRSGGGDAATALMGGQVDARYALSADVARFVKSGEERVLLALSDVPLPGMEDVPLASKYGLKKPLTMRSGIIGPKTLPAEIRDGMAELMKKVIKSKEFTEFALSQSAIAQFRPGDEWAKLMKEDGEIFKEVVKELQKK